MTQTILILGGSGKVARQLTLLLASSTTPPPTIHSIIRTPSQIPNLQSLGATPHVHSLESTTVPALASLIRSLTPPPTAIVWAAGAGGGDPGRTESVDHHGAVKAMDAAAEAGVMRFVLVSALDVRDRSKEVPGWYSEDDKALSERVWGAIGPYMRAKLAADRELVGGNGRRGLRWTIVRPGRLVDGEGRGRVAAGRCHLGEAVSRADVAGVVVECLGNEGTVGLAFDVLGGEMPLKEAVEGVVERKEDCFQDFI